MSMDNKSLGKKGEDAAAAYLERIGYETYAKNVAVRAGEVDLVMRAPDGTLVFVEVKTRRSSRFGTSLEAITYKKRRDVRRAVGLLLKKYAWRGSWRIDVIGIDVSGKRAKLTHVKNIGI